MNVLLVEPYYGRKYPPLGLMKIATWHKRRGDTVQYVRANSFIDVDFKPHIIYVTSLFTWDLPVVVSTVNTFKHRFPNAKIKIGGVGASAMPEYVKEKTGIVPHIGVLKNIDDVPPDYTISEETKKLDSSLVFTSRGCPHKCDYCIVKTLEPKQYIIKGWAKSIDSSKKKTVLFDNNILYSPDEHVKKVFRVLGESGKPFDINSGFDVFLFKKHHAKGIAELPIKPIRFAFDKKSQEKALLRSVAQCVDAGIDPDKIRVFVLYNFNDTPEDARYRADKVISLGCKPFAMRYRPLDDWKKDYIAPQWKPQDVVNFAYYYNMPVVWNTMSYDKFVNERKENVFEKMRHQLNNKLPKEQQILDVK